MNRWRSWIAGGVAILLLYLIANVLLVGGQKLWHRGDQARLDQLQAFLKDERSQIEQLEGEMKVCSEQDTTCTDLLNRYSRTDKIHKAELKKLDSLNQRVTQLESSVRGCLPDVSDCQAQYRKYSETVDSYNSEVRTANASLRRLTAVRRQLNSCAATLQHCEDLSTEYSSRVDAYNAKVPDANALAKKVGTYWYVVPVPKFGSHADE
jgi:chromosome segregation ATPase